MDVTNSKRVLVISETVFVVSHLCSRLFNDGCDVLCEDNFYSGANKVYH